jgi:3-phosphoshikimate 1-carboxyvinyltransferase
MPDIVEIQPCGPVSGSIRPPGSKSLTNRALVCAALASGTSQLTGALDSEDTQVMIESLGRLGIAIELDASKTQLTVHGCGGTISASQAELEIGNSGTTVRFLTALASLGRGTFRLRGTPRMHQRPIADLLAALAQLGGNAQSEQNTDCPPLVVHSDGLQGGVCQVRGNISSQYLSAILMVAPYARENVRIEVVGELVSRPYIEMTLAVMQQFGVELDAQDLEQFNIPANQVYSACDYAIEPDASAASYFLAAAAITGGTVTVEGLSRTSMQGDVRFAEVLAEMGCDIAFAENSITAAGFTAKGLTTTGQPLTGIEVDMNDISDTVQTLAAVALFADSPTTIHGVAHNRYKETDRIADLATELRRLGATVDELEDGMRITPQALRPATIETYDDHRMAMSLALVGLRQPGVLITNPGCTSKTYPAFFDDLARLAVSAK